MGGYWSLWTLLWDLSELEGTILFLAVPSFRQDPLQQHQSHSLGLSFLAPFLSRTTWNVVLGRRVSPRLDMRLEGLLETLLETLKPVSVSKQRSSRQDPLQEHFFKGWDIQNLGSNNDLINLSPRILDEPLKVFLGSLSSWWLIVGHETWQPPKEESEPKVFLGTV